MIIFLLSVSTVMNDNLNFGVWVRGTKRERSTCWSSQMFGLLFLVHGNLFKIFSAKSCSMSFIFECTNNKCHKAQKRWDDYLRWQRLFPLIRSVRSLSGFNDKMPLIDDDRSDVKHETCSVFKGNEWFYRYMREKIAKRPLHFARDLFVAKLNLSLYGHDDKKEVLDRNGSDDFNQQAFRNITCDVRISAMRAGEKNRRELHEMKCF